MSSGRVLAHDRLGALSHSKARLLELYLKRGGKASAPLKPVPRETAAGNARMPVSPAQQRLLFIHDMEGGSAAYHIPLAIRLRGRLGRAVLQAALNALVERHEALRTVFPVVGEERVQEIVTAAAFSLESIDVEAGAGMREAEIDCLSREALTAPFDLTRGPLARARLLVLDAEEHVLLVIMHHLIADGWSLDVFISELAQLYSSYREGVTAHLPPLIIQYADYASWQRERNRSPELKQHLEYWKEHLRAAPQLLELPLDRPRPAAQSYRGASVPIAISAGLATQLRTLAGKHNVTLAMLLHTAWCVFLSRISGQTDIVVGLPVANRRSPEVEGLIGLFVNTLAVRVIMDDAPSLADLLERIREVMLSAYAHQDAPFEQVVEALQPSRSLSHSPLFQVLFALRTEPRGVLQVSGLMLTEEDVPLHAAQFDLSLILRESASTISGVLTYATDLFDSETIQRWTRCFHTVLRGIARFPHSQVSRLPLLPADERQRVVKQFNSTDGATKTDALIHELFERQVERAPAEIAVVSEEGSLTYAQLNAKANQLAAYLLELGVGPDHLVGICVERGPAMVIGLLGILKAGGAYVPLDPSYPTERLDYMLRNAAPDVLLVQQRLRARLPATTARVVALDADWDKIALRPSSNIDARAFGLRASNLAYVIYTSGSTGRPKGAMNEHCGLINRLVWMQAQYRLGNADRVLQKTPFSFDVSVWEFFWTLITGARLVMARPDGHKDAEYLRAFIEVQGITTLHFVPSMLQTFLDGYVLGQCSSINHVVCSGEELPLALQNRCLELLPQARLSNLYGPTEAAIDVTHWECEPGMQGGRVPIGRPVANTQMYVLDHQFQPTPVGVVGEIYIGGVQVGRGYLYRPELTAERFVADPFSSDSRFRLYKTGDLGRWRVDGAIEYLGRNDFQVKIRGFRIELAEIEDRLLAHEQVKEAVVVAREDVAGEKRLVAYFVPEVDAMPTVDALRVHLKATLPDHMVPSAFVRLDRMPLSPNGKLERRALPPPDESAYSRREYEAPEGETEQTLAAIWESLLRVERVGRQDSFFELGGHSLLLVQMMDRLRKAGLNGDVRRVFESPRLADLARTVAPNDATAVESFSNAIPSSVTAITPEMLPLVQLTREHIDAIVRVVPGGGGNIQDIYPLAPLQEGILFHHLLSGSGGDTYVVPTVVAIASRGRLNELIVALQAVIDRHDALRTSILWEELPRPVQVVQRRVQLPVQEVLLDAHRPVQEQIVQWLAPEHQWLDLRAAPLMRLKIAGDPHSSEWYVLMQMHHIVGDATAREILVSEVSKYLDGNHTPLPPAIPYRRHVEQALAYERMHDTEAFFRRKLRNVDEPTAPFGIADVHRDGAVIEEAHEKLDPVLANGIRAQARRLNVSTATIFHAAWSLVVAHTSGRDDVVFGTVLLGRLHGDAGAQRIFGMFINTLPLRLQLRALTVKDLIDATQRELVELLQHEQASLAVAQRCSGLPGSSALFSALLNYRRGNSSAHAEWSQVPGIRSVAGRERTNYPIVVSVDDDDLDFTISVQTDQCIDPQRLAGYLGAAVHSLVTARDQAPATAALTLEILPHDERRLVVEQFNDTAAAYPRAAAVHELFEQQVATQPDAAAVIFEGKVLSYQQLNDRVNQLARYLRKQGVTPGDYVPVHMTRSLGMLVAQIAVLKCGAAYVPVDPELPSERRCFMIRDSRAQVALTDGDLLQLPELGELRWVDCMSAAVSEQSTQNLNLPVDSLSAAYVMFTSGSTGIPKGVIVPHRAVNRLAVNNGFVPITSEDCVAHYSNPAFDASTLEIWGALLNGAQVVVIPQSVVLEPVLFAHQLEHYAVTTLYMSVGLFNQYADVLAGVFRNLRHLMVGGDALDPTATHRVLRQSPPQRLLNVYGPTECTTISTSYLVATARPEAKSLPIGQPMSNAQVYILNAHGSIAPIGVVGELYIGGDGVALGYLHRPELTAERFISDPFSSDRRARLYKTGDLGRWRADGTIEFLGRNDLQVKMRGFRIELGEIDARLSQHTQVREAVVLARQDEPGEKRLVAYVVASDSAKPPRVEDLRGHLRGVLPDYMVPSAFVLLDTMPLTSTGKVNRRALRAPQAAAYGDGDGEFEAPQGDVEAGLAAIYRDVLGLDSVSRWASFFDQGGHSLLAVQALVRINAMFNGALRITDLYKYPTIEKLAERVTTGPQGEALVDLAQEATLDPDIVGGGQSVRVPAEGVLLTGATGFVGRFLLSQLLQQTSATIYCLVRAKSATQASERLRATMIHWGLWRDEFESRVLAVPGDLRSPRLGLDPRCYDLICDSVDSIYHCGTSMNHLETYSMAKAANVDSARELLRIATTSTPKLVNYISTLGVFSKHTGGAAREVDETTSIDREKHSTVNGYVASKWVAEKIFMLASQRGIACNIFRIGLVWADAQFGRYDELQHVYRLFKSCLLSGYGIENYRHDELVPTAVDYVAQSVALLAGRHGQGGGVFHISAPSQMEGGWFERCNRILASPLTLLPYYKWIQVIKRLHEQGITLPIVPLIEYVFAMDERSFVQHQGSGEVVLRVQSSRTHGEIEQAGIVAPVVTEELLKVFVEDALTRDPELRERFRGR